MQAKRKYHIILSFEDKGEIFYVTKYFGIHKRWWHYEVWDEWLMSFNKDVKHYNIVDDTPTKKKGNGKKVNE